MSIFTTIPDELASLRKIPITGTWAMIIGNPYASRGCRLPQFCEKYNLRRMDIVYVYNEQISSTIIKTIFKKIIESNYKAKLKYGDFKKLSSLFTEEHVSKEIKRILNEDPFPTSNKNIYDTNISIGEVVRFWDVELSFLTEEKIKYYLSENAIYPVNITGGQLQEVPLLQDEIKELIGAFELDGLTHNEALNELIPLLQKELSGDTSKEEDVLKHIRIPAHYYKVTDEVYNYFN